MTKSVAKFITLHRVVAVVRLFAIVQERCPKCDYHELNYYTMQLRSADEGQTVFYECTKCNHNFSVNN
jgi:DNA-directed RNA polymerase I subunit RPA12